MSDVIINKVANSGLITVDLEEWVKDVHFECFDLTPLLWQGLALREADLRDFLKKTPVDFYNNHWVYILMPPDVVIPQWAHLLIGSHFGNHAKGIFVGNLDSAKEQWLHQRIQALDVADYDGARVIIKGCTSPFVTRQIQMSFMLKVLPVVKSLMFGEPCSTVPLFKR